MSDFPAASCPATYFDRAVTAFHRHAFAALLAGEAPSVAEVAEAASRDADGRLPDHSASVLWIPHGPCENVMRDFCVHANLFCGPEHLDAWRHAADDPPGEVVTFAGIPARARAGWADVAARP